MTPKQKLLTRISNSVIARVVEAAPDWSVCEALPTLNGVVWRLNHRYWLDVSVFEGTLRWVSKTGSSSRTEIFTIPHSDEPLEWSLESIQVLTTIETRGQELEGLK
jgi:hypothetical protein